MKVSYNHITKYIDSKPSISDISENLFQLGHEHEIIENNIFDLEITPNRGDCLSLNGILRELKSFYDVNFKQTIYQEELKSFEMNFQNESHLNCPKISFLKIKVDESISEYVGDLKNYFEDLNLNKNNFFADVSNFISYEQGQPTHCYDSSLITKKLTLKEIEKEDKFTTLLGNEIKLKGKNLVFSMEDEIINLAGIMGSKSTCCSENTRSVLVECAYFNPESIIGKSLEYDLQSEAAYKFERGVDFENHLKVLRRFLSIVSEHTDIIEVMHYCKAWEQRDKNKILFECTKINKILGLELSKNEIIGYLEKINIKLREEYLIIPSYRNDLISNNDIAEEVARIIGYNNINSRQFVYDNKNITNVFSYENALRNFFKNLGFSESINYPFVNNNSSGSIILDNPLDSNKCFMRQNLKDSLIDNLLFNERRQKETVKIFEISDVYTLKKELSKKRIIGIIASGRIGNSYIDFSKKIDETYLKEIFKDLIPHELLKFESVSRLSLNSKKKTQIFYLELEIKKLTKDIFKISKEIKPSNDFIKYSQISEFPSSLRDLSFLIKDYSDVSKLENIVLNFKNDILRDVFVFDFYENVNSNEIKMGFRFIFQSKLNTINDKQVDEVIDEIIKQTIEIKSVSIPGL